MSDSPADAIAEVPEHYRNYVDRFPVIRNRGNYWTSSEVSVGNTGLLRGGRAPALQGEFGGDLQHARVVS
jgi:hypothetical protein